VPGTRRKSVPRRGHKCRKDRERDVEQRHAARTGGSLDERMKGANHAYAGVVIGKGSIFQSAKAKTRAYANVPGSGLENSREKRVREGGGAPWVVH